MEQLQSHGLLQDLALILIVAAFTTVLFQKLKQPVVLGYLLAGLIVGPYVPIPLFADMDRIHTLSELGVILVMFAIGLEFSFRRLARLATTAGVVGLLQICVMFWLGYTIGLSFGWTRLEAMYAGAMISISSTMIIAKAFSDQAITGKLSELVIGILIVEDVAAILMIALLSAFSTGRELPTDILIKTGLQLTGFLFAAVAIGILIFPRVIRSIVKLRNDETLLVASIGICFGYAYIAQKGGYSVALGAFVAGALIAESGHTAKIEHLARPLRDVFAAVFFISVGMLMDPAALLQHWKAILVLTLVVLLGKFVSVFFGAFLMGTDARTSVRAGMSMAQIGEFSFIIASAGIASGSIRDFIYPVAIAICVVTTFTTPGLIRLSGPVASFVLQKLPDRLKTLATLYTAWVDRLRHMARLPISMTRKIFGILILDTVILWGIVAAHHFYDRAMEEIVQKVLPVQESDAHRIVMILILLIAVPFLLSIFRAARSLGAILANHVLPEASKLDLADAPRKTMTLVIEFLTVMIIGTILMIVTLPFLPAFSVAFLLAVVVAIFGWIVWRGATDLQAHLQAGAQVIVEALSRDSQGHEQTVEEMEQLLPGLSNIESIELQEGQSSIGKTLAQLDIHGLTGALVVGILRSGKSVVVPGGNEVLCSGDVLAILGSDDAVEAAKRILAES
jgi:CPA2 family monovalent cation:H+ antiporter-2